MTRLTPVSAGADLRVCRFSSIHEIPEALWDELLQGCHHPYHTHRLLRTVEDARVGNSRFWFIVFWNGDRPVATAVLSAFTVSLDIFLGKRFQMLVALVRNLFPSFLRIEVLFCGLPASFGQSNIVISNCIRAEPVLALLASEMKTISQEVGLRFLCLKEFRASTLSDIQCLEQLGFFRAHSIPSMVLKVRWRTFNQYLNSLRHSYRRNIRRSLAMGMTQPEVRPFTPDALDDPHPRLVLGGPEVMSPSSFFRLYRNVMARTETRLETLNEAFFERLWLELGRDLKILAAVAGGRVLGAALLLKTGAALHFMLVGLPEERKTHHDVYLNLIYAICDQAIRQGCQQLNLGQTGYWKKLQIGGEPDEEFLFFKALNPGLHAVLNALRSVLFPRVFLKPARIFK